MMMMMMMMILFFCFFFLKKKPTGAFYSWIFKSKGQFLVVMVFPWQSRHEFFQEWKNGNIEKVHSKI
jgi:hypothetical protein